MHDNLLVLNESDWQYQQVLPHYSVWSCWLPQIKSRMEVLSFRPGFRLVRQYVRSCRPIWQPAFLQKNYLGCGFNFCRAAPQSLALPHLYHQKMNISSGYAFDGGVNDIDASQPMYYVALQFERDFIESLAAEQALPEWLRRLCRESGIIDATAVPLAMRERAWQLTQLPPADNLTLRLQLEAMALQWLADALSLAGAPSVNVHIDDVIDIIRSEYHEPLTISLLAKRIGTNACYLKQQFKAQTGLTINAFITRERLQQAQHLLHQRPELSIKMIAELCGYRAAYFTTLFKKHHGITPDQYRLKAFYR